MKALQVEPLISVKNILYPTDFSPVAESAFPFVCAVARIFKSRVTAVHVRTPHFEALMPPFSFPHQVESTDQLIEKLQSTFDYELKDLEHGLLVGEGEVWDFIAKVIEEREIDLVVIGTQGKSGLEKLMLGSVAELIFRQANCPVLTIGPHAVVNNTHGMGNDEHSLGHRFYAGLLSCLPVSLLVSERAPRPAHSFECS